ncbi:MAG: hypothetical protein DK306_001765 [Chloroflexi bacterium]|nr:MAG: hypothetical protein DK306_001765 [Chloroflexota bacterium]
MMLIAASMILLAVSGTALGFGIACVADGNGDPDCVLLVLAPVLAGLPLAAALGIWGAAGRGWLGRWARDEEDAADSEGVIMAGGQQSVLRQAHDERILPPGRDEGSVPFDSAQDRLRPAQDERIRSEGAPHV